MCPIFGPWVCRDIPFEITFSAKKILSGNQKEISDNCVPVSDVTSVSRMT
jgi:hypothetical protein